MSIKYACFISYPHYSTKYVETFLDQLKIALETSIEPYLNQIRVVYQDKYNLEKNIPDEELTKKLGQAICESVCWIIIFGPAYQERIWCLREFMAMEQIEEKRKQLLGSKYDRLRTMIFPLIIDNKSHIPNKVREISINNFLTYELISQKNSKSNNTERYLEALARIIYKHFFNLRTLNYNKSTNECTQFKLSSVEDTKKWWDKT